MLLQYIQKVSASQLAPLASYVHKFTLWLVFFVLTRTTMFNYNIYYIFIMMLHARLANPTYLQSFNVRYCLVCELCELNWTATDQNGMLLKQFLPRVKFFLYCSYI